MKLKPTCKSLAAGSTRALICFVLLAALVIVTGSQAAAREGNFLTIAVIPSAPPLPMHTQWTPFLERLTRETGFQFRLKLFEQMSEFEREIGKGTPDLILASPFQTVVAHQMSGYQPLVRGGKDVAVGLFVRKDSAVRNIDDLAGSSISFVGNKNLCSVLIRHLLTTQKNKISFASEYSGSTRNVIKSVLLGKSTAGAVFIPELEREPVENRAQLRSVIETQKIAPHPLSAHPRVSREVREAVKRVVLQMADTREGAELLKTVRLPAPVVADYQRDYQSLEIIDVKGLTDWGK